MLTRAAIAAKARHAALEPSTSQELPELLLDELGEAMTITRLGCRPQERLQMFTDHLMQHGVLGVSRGDTRAPHTACLWVARSRLPAHAQRWIHGVSARGHPDPERRRQIVPAPGRSLSDRSAPSGIPVTGRSSPVWSLSRLA